jgi:hypothetical protein
MSSKRDREVDPSAAAGLAQLWRATLHEGEGLERSQSARLEGVTLEFKPMRGPRLLHTRDLRPVVEIEVDGGKMSLSIQALAEKCSDAHSTKRYGGWVPTVTLLREHGYNDHEIEVIVRSKWPRWAADEGEKPNGRASAEELLEYVRKAGPGGARRARRRALFLGLNRCVNCSEHPPRIARPCPAPRDRRGAVRAVQFRPPLRKLIN